MNKIKPNSSWSMRAEPKSQVTSVSYGQEKISSIGLRVALPLNRKHVVTLAQAHRHDLELLGVKTLELFGSVARNEAHPNSDVDFLVEFAIEPTLFDVFRVQHYLEDLLGCAVDMGTRAALKAHLREPATKDTVCVF